MSEVFYVYDVVIQFEGWRHKMNLRQEYVIASSHETAVSKAMESAYRKYNLLNSTLRVESAMAVRRLKDSGIELVVDSMGREVGNS